MTQLRPFQVENFYQSQSSATKLRGQYFTPPSLVALMLDALEFTPSTRIIDPSCGDGSFLRGAVTSLRRRFPDADGRVLAETWRDRLIGFDIDNKVVDEARRGLQEAFRQYLGVEVPPDQFHVYNRDVLSDPCLFRLLRGVGIAGLEAEERLLVVGNPPYVDAKRLSRELKRELKARYADALSGAPDLYLYFVHVCLAWLRRQDRLALVLPNKLLVNSNGQAVRKRLLSDNRLDRLWFATEARLFGDAAVYPIVLFASGPRPVHHGGVEVRRLTRGDDHRVGLNGRVVVDPGAYVRTSAKAFYAPPETELLGGALEQLVAAGCLGRLDDVLDIRWSVSFHRAGLRERYVTPGQPSTPHAHRFLGGGAFAGNGEVKRFEIRWAGWWMDYDQDRLRIERNGVPDREIFERPKIVICQNGRTLRAAYDENGFVLKDTFLCGCIRKVPGPLSRHPRALVGLLCSRAIHFFYSHVFYGGHVSGGYLHYLRSFLMDIPVGAWSEALAAEVAGLVRQREDAGRKDRFELEERIEELVGGPLGLTKEQQAGLREWAKQDGNWRARERVRGPARV